MGRARKNVYFKQTLASQNNHFQYLFFPKCFNPARLGGQFGLVLAVFLNATRGQGEDNQNIDLVRFQRGDK